MTGLLPDDEHEAAGTLRALLAAKEKAEAERDDLLANNHLKADAIDRWINTSAEQNKEIEELKAERDALRKLLRQMIDAWAGAPTGSIHLEGAVERAKQTLDTLDQPKEGKDDEHL